MKKISAEQFTRGVMSIYEEDPEYRTGGDGSDGTCDCIGMIRGALEREGATEVKGMNGTNYAARHTIIGLQKLKKESQLAVGDIVMKTRGKDDKSMRLPDQYRKGGNDYSKTWGETNFTHIGTVVQVNPIRICHMTSPKAKIDSSISGWTYFGKLPWIAEEAEETQTQEHWATVYAANGKPVKMRDKPSTLCRLYWEVPSGSQVILKEMGETWSSIIWAGQSGWMMTEYLRDPEQKYTVIIPGLDLAQAEALINTYKDAEMEEERG